MDLEKSLSTTERAHRAARLLAMNRTLSDSPDLQTFLELLIAAAGELTSCETASILELEEGGEQLHFLAVPWFHRNLLKSIKIPVKASVAGWVLENEKPAFVPDVTAEPRHFKGVESHLTRKHGGMGLGLSVAKVMTELHSGRIWVESVVGKGSNFTFLLPVKPVRARAGSRVFVS
jgi:Histidine kinase-, DNA gyrase B-, and HSP90-like ATPase